MDDEPDRIEAVTDVRPYGERALVRLEEQPTISRGGIYLPDQAKERPARGVVLRVGDDPPEGVVEGVMVIIKPWGGPEVTVAGQHCQLVEYENILGIVTDPELRLEHEV